MSHLSLATGEQSVQFDQPPEHGGRLRLAAERYGIPLHQWVDLSTGVNPNPWPVPTLRPDVWSRLPEDDDGLENAAAGYYEALGALPVAGSQAAILEIPQMRPACRVGVPSLGYQEHAYAWHIAGHELVVLPDGEPPAGAFEGQRRLDCLVVINPNNPTGVRWPVERLLEWHNRLAAHGGWLIVDEAFMDPTPAGSLLPYIGRPGLIVLRSLGKFFGLAGARVGFAFAESAFLDRLRLRLGPWTVAGPSRAVATGALGDLVWQATARANLCCAGERLADLLSAHGLSPAGGSALFQWVVSPKAHQLHAALAAKGILVRLFDDPPSLRFGLPGSEAQWHRLDQALETLVGDEAGSV